MATDQDEEIEGADSDTQNNGEEDENTDEDADGDADGADDGDDAEGDDAGNGDSDDDATLPKTRKELNDAIAKGVRDALKKSNNRSAADRRTSGKDRLQDGKRAPKGDERMAGVESTVAKLETSEAKRTFGYENNLAPDEVDVLVRLNGGKIPSAKILKDPVAKGALEGHRQAKRLKGNLPSGGNARPIPVSGKDFAKLPPGEQRKNFSARRQQILDQKRGGRGGD